MKIYKKTVLLLIALVIAIIFMVQAYAQANQPNCMGIGTTDPKSFLDIRGDYNAPALSPDEYMHLRLADITGNSKLYVGVDTSDDYGGMGYFNGRTGDWGSLILQAKGGKVGIGTTSPEKKLHVKGDVRIEGIVTVNAVQSPDGTSIGIPPGMLAPFATPYDASHPCPPGWSPYGLLDNRVPRGVPAGQIPNLGTSALPYEGGADTHAHFISGARARGREDASAAQDQLWTQQTSSWPPYRYIIWCRKD